MRFLLLLDYSQAVIAFKRVIEVRIQTNNGDIYDASIAQIHALLGMSFYHSYHFQKSLQHYRQSLTIRSFCFKKNQGHAIDSFDNHKGEFSDIECAKLWNNIGKFEFISNEYFNFEASINSLALQIKYIINGIRMCSV